MTYSTLTDCWSTIAPFLLIGGRSPSNDQNDYLSTYSTGNYDFFLLTSISPPLVESRSYSSQAWSTWIEYTKPRHDNNNVTDNIQNKGKSSEGSGNTLRFSAPLLHGTFPADLSITRVCQCLIKHFLDVIGLFGILLAWPVILTSTTDRWWPLDATKGRVTEPITNTWSRNMSSRRAF